MSDKEPPAREGHPTPRRMYVAFATVALLALALSSVGAALIPAQTPGSIPEGFTRIFNGKDIAGWHPSRTAHHGKTPQLTVKDGAVYILQQPFGQGGLLLTNKKYGDFDFYVETDLKPGFNSGIFMRSTEEGAAYQVELDANAGNGRPLGESLRLGRSATIGPPTAKTISDVWKRDDWNSFRVRMVGATPRLTVWVNGELLTDLKYPANDMIAGMTTGFIGLQFHFLTSTGPSSMVMPLSYNTPGVPLGFRNMAIKEIDKATADSLASVTVNPPGAVPAGGAAGGGRGQAQAGAPAQAPAPPPPPGPADYKNSIGMEFMQIKTGHMFAGKYNPNPIVPNTGQRAAGAPNTSAGATPQAASGDAAAGRGGQAGSGRAGGGGRAGWTEGQYALAEKLRQQSVIPAFTATIATPYHIGLYEVTQGEWKSVMGNNPSVFQGDKVTDDADRHPVDSVTWDDAQAFIKKLNQMENTTAYRLPTEMEWEWASRAGSMYANPTPGESGSSQQPRAVFSQQAGTTAMVGSKWPNEWGLYDMLGNVWEWVQDYYNDKVMPDAKPPAKGTTHVLKGASFMSHVANVVSTVHAGGPGDGFSTGFRIVKEVR